MVPDAVPGVVGDPGIEAGSANLGTAVAVRQASFRVGENIFPAALVIEPGQFLEKVLVHGLNLGTVTPIPGFPGP